MEFPSPAAQPFTRRFIDRRMRQLDIRPLDHAGGIVRFGLIITGLFVAVFIVFALVAPISGAAVTAGEIVQGGDKLVVQPLESGLVTQMLVHEGQRVRAGQPLVRLDDLRARSQLGQAQGRYDSLRAREARLIAEIGGQRTLAFPADLIARANDPTIAATLAAERAEFRHHRALLAADRRLNASQLSTSHAQAVATARQQALILDELTSYRQLYEEGFARKTTVRSLERNAAQLQADRAATLGSVGQASIQSTRIVDAQAMDATSSLDQVRQQIDQLAPQLAIARDVSDRMVLRAPANGRVSGVSDLGPGSMVSGGRTVMELIPDGRPLIAQVQVKPQDIDDVRIGQPATLRFSSVNKHGKGAFAGHVVTLSPARVGGDGGQFYRAQIAFDDPTGARRDGLVLQPGIPVSANIKTQDRSLFQYLFYPLIDAMSRAFREE